MIELEKMDTGNCDAIYYLDHNDQYLCKQSKEWFISKIYLTEPGPGIDKNCDKGCVYVKSAPHDNLIIAIGKLKEIHKIGERLNHGTRVRTVKPDKISNDWMPEALVKRKFGVTGTIINHHDSHGLCYDVRHDEGAAIGCYDPWELEVLDD